MTRDPHGTNPNPYSNPSSNPYEIDPRALPQQLGARPQWQAPAAGPGFPGGPGMHPISSVPGFPGTGFPGPGQPARTGMSGCMKAIIIILVAGGLLMVAICGGLAYIGVNGPDTKVVPGANVRRDHMQAIEKLGLLEPGEQVQYFYSDALVDPTEGMYFITDRKVVVYASGNVTPATLVPYKNIVGVDVEYSDSMWIDSTVWLDLDDDSTVTFPVSAESGGDRKFMDALKANWRKAVPDAEAAGSSPRYDE